MAVASVADDVIRVTHLAHARTNKEILAFVAEFAAAPITITVDAPTITHPTGMRQCEKELQQRFWRVHAGPYPGRTDLLGKCNNGVPRGTEVVRELRERFGVTEVGLTPARHAGKHVMEVFPAAAMAVFFDLKSPLPYKKKRGRDWGDVSRRTGGPAS